MKRKKKQKQGAPIETQGDALATIATLEDKGAHEALKFVGDIMERNAEQNYTVTRDLLEAEQADHDETKRELREARYELQQIKDRVAWLLGGQMPYDMRVEFEEIAEDVINIFRERGAP